MRVLTHCNAGWLAFVDIGRQRADLRGSRSGEEVSCLLPARRARVARGDFNRVELAQEGIFATKWFRITRGHLMQRGMVIWSSWEAIGRSTHW